MLAPVPTMKYSGMEKLVKMTGARYLVLYGLGTEQKWMQFDANKCNGQSSK